MDDKRIVLNFFESNLHRYGNDPRGVGWGTIETQYRRFEVLCGIGDLSGMNILDVGCGLAEFYNFLMDKNIKVNYTGLDMSPSMIKQARERYPHLLFLCVDFLKLNSTRKYDFVLSSGAFNIKISNNLQLVKKAINQMCTLANLGVAANFTSSYTDSVYRKDFSYYYSPEKLFKHAMKISKKVVLRCDYLPNDFTIYIYQ